MKEYSNKTAIGLSTVIFTIVGPSVFANSDWVENIESKQIQLKNIIPTAFDCYSYDNGYSRSYLSLADLVGLPDKTLFEHSTLASWDWQKDLQRCNLVEEIRSLLLKNANKINVDLTVKTSTSKREYRDPRLGKICNIDLIEEMQVSFPNGLIYKDFNAPQGNMTCSEYESIMDKSSKKNNFEISCLTTTNFIGRTSEGYPKYYFGSNTFTLQPGEFFELAYASLNGYSHFFVPQVRVEVMKTEPFSVIYGINTADPTESERWVLKTLDNPNGFEFRYRDSYPVFCKLQQQN